MGGIQSKECAIVEVHSIRNSQVILRARSAKVSGIRSLPVSRAGSVRSINNVNGNGNTSGGALPGNRNFTTGSGRNFGRSTSGGLQRSFSDSLNRNCSMLKLRARCLLMEQSLDILEKILKFLTARELVMLSLTSKALNLVVRTYIDHQCERMTIRRQFDEFCERNRDCLLPKEVVLKDRLNQNLRPNLLLFSTGNHYMGHVMRVSFLNVNHFAHLNREMVKEEFDVALKRDVISIKSQRVPLHLVHVFSNVAPGTYVVQFRIRMPESKLAFLYRNTADANVTPATIVVRTVPWSIPCFCDDPDQADITPVERDIQDQNADGGVNLFPFPLINIRDSEPTMKLAEQTINARHWIRIWEHTHITRYNTCPPTLSNAYLRFDSATDWFFIELKPFRVEKTCQLQVEFSAEAEEFRWKKGMYWDFLELRQVLPKHQASK